MFSSSIWSQYFLLKHQIEGSLDNPNTGIQWKSIPAQYSYLLRSKSTLFEMYAICRYYVCRFGSGAAAMAGWRSARDQAFDSFDPRLHQIRHHCCIVQVHPFALLSPVSRPIFPCLELPNALSIDACVNCFPGNLFLRKLVNYSERTNERTNLGFRVPTLQVRLRVSVLFVDSFLLCNSFLDLILRLRK